MRSIPIIWLRHTCLSSLLAAMPLLADSTPAPTPTPDPQLVEAQRQLAIAQAQQATAEAQAATYKAQIGQITSALPKGTATADKTEFEASYLAYKAAAKAAKNVADIVAAVKPKPTAVLLYSAKEISNLVFFKAVNDQAGLLLTRIKEFEKQPPLKTEGAFKPCAHQETVRPRSVSVAPLLVVDTALTLISLFKSDFSFVGQSVTADDFAIAALVASSLREQKISVVYPPLYYPGLFSAAAPPKSALLATLETLMEKQFEMSKTLADSAAKKAELTRLGTAEPDKDCKAVYQADIATMDARENEIKSTEGTLSQFLAGLMKANDQGGAALLQSLLSGEQLATGLKGGILLQVKSVAAGGGTKTRSNIFGSKLWFHGGIVLTYVLTDDKGLIVASGTVPVYGGFVEASRMGDSK